MWTDELMKTKSKDIISESLLQRLALACQQFTHKLAFGLICVFECVLDERMQISSKTFSNLMQNAKKV